MAGACREGNVTLVAVVVLVVLVVIVGCLVIASMSAVRSTPYMGSCRNNMRNLGTAMHNYEGSFKSFPSASMLKPGTNTPSYSWLVQILPQSELSELYYAMKISTNPEPSSNKAARKATIPLFRCLIYGSRNNYATPGQPNLDWITNYKAIAATSQRSAGFTGAGEPPYGTAAMHPDGAMPPGRKTRIADLVDGTTYTVIVVETIEPKSAVWYDGSTAYLTGLPDSVTYGEFEKAALPGGDRGRATYFAPTGFTHGKFGEQSTIANNVTYLNWNYQGSGHNAGPYIDSDYRFGPSSNHPGAVMHLFGDAQARAISKNIDQALYMFLITRAGGDPADLDRL